MAFIYVFFAAILAAATNLCLRKNVQYNGSVKAYFTLYFALSLLCPFILIPDLFTAPFSPVIFLAGSVAGILNYSMMMLIARALQNGPSGLTFAFQNSGSILPAFILFFLFGSSFGFTMSATILLGFLSILIGLFISARSQSVKKEEKLTVPSSPRFAHWVFLVIVIFFLQGITLSLFFWKDLLMFPCEPNQHFLLPWKCLKEEEIWFMPGFFLLPTILESFFFWKQEKRGFSKKEVLFGVSAGLFNGGATFFLLMGAATALNNQKPILFPLFAIMIIFLCNLWGKFLYQEKVNWFGMGLCLLGVLLGTL